MAAIQITCVNKPDRFSAHEHITHIGNSTGKITTAEAIKRIESGSDTFYTVDQIGRRVDILVVRGVGNMRPYLRTHADGQWRDNLLALPECS